MKKLLIALTSLALLPYPAHAGWDEISKELSELGDAVSESAKEAWDSTKAFSKKAWQDFTNWSKEAINTLGEWTDASIEKSKEWIAAADKKIEELMQGDTPEQARQAIDLMADSTLLKVFNQQPETKTLYDLAYGYAVFDSRKLSLLFQADSGSGVAVDKHSGQRTYMNMIGAGVDLEVSNQTYQQLVLFESQEDFLTFIIQGSGTGRDGSLPSDERSDHDKATQFHQGLAVYQINAEGQLMPATLSGSLYWVNRELTDTQSPDSA
ncbi:hypothetical protein [Vibrio sp. CAU 1672]|uniref:hypothetical protein n=1 Tax=Vibrio sp. CAU 1672 TaxID=3032594 RepID=UPI0023DB67BE|nr:hypothetical protein [Vibrio sp. CAU 1672]MDF2152952.1 hypothetical protein [Vibrio sp. CAU 1672]